MASVAKTTDRPMPPSITTGDDSNEQPHPAYALSTSGCAIPDPVQATNDPMIISARREKFRNAAHECHKAQMSGKLSKLVPSASESPTGSNTALSNAVQQALYLGIGYTNYNAMISVEGKPGPYGDRMKKAQATTIGGSAPPSNAILPKPKDRDPESRLMPVVIECEPSALQQDDTDQSEAAAPLRFYVLLRGEDNDGPLLPYRVDRKVIFFRAQCRTVNKFVHKRLADWPERCSEYVNEIRHGTNHRTERVGDGLLADDHKQANTDVEGSSKVRANESIDNPEVIGNTTIDLSHPQTSDEQLNTRDQEMHDAPDGEDLTASQSNTAIETQDSSSKALQPTQISKESVSDPQIRTRSLLEMVEARIKVAGDKRRCNEISPSTPQSLLQNGSTGYSHTNNFFPSKRLRRSDIEENENHDEVKATKSRRIRTDKPQVIKAQSPIPELASKAVKTEAQDVIEISDDDEESTSTPMRQRVDLKIIEKFIDIENRDWTAVDSSAFISKVKEIWSQDGNKQHLQDLTIPLVRRAKSVINNLNSGFVTVSRDIVPGFLYSCMRFPDPSWDDVQQAHQSLSIQMSPARIAPVQRLDDAVKFAT